MATEPIKTRLFCTVEIEIEPDVLDDGYRVTGRYDGGILFESSVPDETVREWQQILCDATSRFDAIAEHVVHSGPSCRVCGCTEDAACEGGCSWIEDDLCSACVGKGAPAAEGGDS